PPLPPLFPYTTLFRSDHGDGTFHYSAPYPFLLTTVAMLQQYVEARPVRSRKTNRYHRGTLRVVMFDGRIVSAIYRLHPDPDDGRSEEHTSELQSLRHL